MKYLAFDENSQTILQNKTAAFKKGDYLVLFGELFNRGYANGLIEAAELRGMKIIRSTVGRRGPDNQLRELTSDEIPNSPHPLINIPLEAGFDLEKFEGGASVSELLSEVKMSTWADFKMDSGLLHKIRQQGENRFRLATQKFIVELTKIIPAGARVHFAHLMAGGVPRARIYMPLMNRVFKGTGDRHLSSSQFWDSGLGHVCASSFAAVSADTYRILLEETEAFRIRSGQGQVSYSAYGYHGTAVWKSGSYKWQSYAPYLQGWAKMELEKISNEFFSQGVNTCVSNCPEILTNSSSIFQGVEVPLYTLVRGIEMEASKMKTEKSRSAYKNLYQKCQQLLKPEVSLEKVLEICEQTLTSAEVEAQSNLTNWPQHNTRAQMETLLKGSEQIIESHLDSKNLMTGELSEVVLKACGVAVLEQAVNPIGPVSWINHDFVVRNFLGN